MERLKMHSLNKVNEKIKKIADLFPNTLTEVMKGYHEDGSAIIEHAIDFDILRQELSDVMVEEREDRYRFTWPDKNKSILLANAPIAKTLRPNKEESVNFEGTGNLYIEGDNLDALKLLQETYLGKVKLIYIDPPYNTGKDFIYEDDFSQSAEKYLANSGQFDEVGNRLVQNTESNGRIHTDWLNMMYPRLHLAKDLLRTDGVIFISIDDNEVENLKKICNEIFGNRNYICDFIRKGSGGRQDSKHYAVVHEYILCYAKSMENFVSGKEIKEDEKYPFYDKAKQRNYKTQLLRKWGENSRRSDRPNLYYPIPDPDGNDHYPMLSQDEEGCWRWGKEKMFEAIENDDIEFKKKNDEWVAYEKIYEPSADNPKTKLYTTILDDIENNTGTALLKELFGGKVFDYPKPVDLIKKVILLSNAKEDDLILDFFSGSATTAHAVMQLNAEDGGNRKFIMVQLPEKIDENAEAFKEGYSNICEIGKERIRRAGKKILESKPELSDQLDIGFRVLKLDSSNMEDVYYKPADYNQEQIDMFVDNIKADRTPNDLLVQVMLELGVLLSSNIEKIDIGGKIFFNVANGYLMACFDQNVTNEVIVEIAKKQPYYAVFRDSSIASDSVATNFEQIFETYSPTTIRKIL